MTPLLSLHGIAKRYGAIQALAGIELEIGAASVHGLVGENGAGKSTLGMIIAGVTQPDGGTMRLRGQPVRFRAPREALAVGVAVIKQELALAPQLTVRENVMLGIEVHGLGKIDERASRDKYERLCEQVDFELPSEARVDSLRLADQQKVEILRALARDAEIIVMDEPTSALTAEEAAKLYEIIRNLRANGKTVVYVSHFLEEVLSLADTVTVLRNGAHIKTTPAQGETPQTLVEAMLGSAAGLAFPPKRPAAAAAATVLSVRGLSRPPALVDVSFDVRAGEIVGLSGLVGSGRSEVARAIFGADRVRSGEVRLDGELLAKRSPWHAVREGLAFLPESRKEQGLVMTSSERANISLPHLPELSRWSVISQRAEKARASALADELGITPSRPERSPVTLSGGNQQKVLLAKWLFRTPRLLILDEPTRGVDVGARRSIHDTIVGLAAEGIPVLLISSDLEEVTGLAHRVLVMHRGSIVAEFDGPDFPDDEIVMASFGLRENDAA